MLTRILSTQHWERISEPLHKSVNWPKSRLGHATIVISDLHVMMIGGMDKSLKCIADSWLFNIDTKTWTKVSYWLSCDLTLPQSELMSMIYNMRRYNKV